MTNIKIDDSWKIELEDEFNSSYMYDLRFFLKEQLSRGKIIFPPMNKIFNAFNLTPFQNVKVVIVGQDPYHGYGQANGLSFSVEDFVKVPPSLRNIFKELYTDLGICQALDIRRQPLDIRRDHTIGSRVIIDMSLE